ncbi:MAG: enoyl-CoA hydratase/isomerase family protein [Deltaproteobacteria bacterium]|nr:enoyl-CoA hydratase/isomerase family protein [Deltaproteobacteria bacterium]
MTYETLMVEKKEALSIITMNRPDNLNSINTKMQAEMKAIWEDLEQDRNIRVIIFTGGEKCFSAGADIKEQFPAGQSRPSSRDQFKKFEDDDRPFIAAISGFCLGGGLELALCCDLRIATESARFGLPELRIGSVPGAGGMQRLPRLIGITRAKELLYTAGRIDAAEAYRIGLINKIVPEASLIDEAVKLAETMLTMPPHGLKIAKRCVNEGMQIDLQTALKLDLAISVQEMSTPTAIENRAEGLAAFREKRKPRFKVG